MISTTDDGKSSRMEAPGGENNHTDSGVPLIKPLAVKVLAPLIGFLMILLIVWQYLFYPLGSPAVDYSKHWLSAVYLLEGRNIYEDELYFSFYYSHFAAAVYFYLAFFTQEQALVLWRYINFGLFMAAILLLTRYLVATATLPSVVDHPKVQKLREYISFAPYVAGLLIITDYHPARTSFNSGNIDPIILLFLALFTICFVKKQDVAAGVFLCLAFLVKFAMLFLIFPLIFLFRWKAVAAFTISCIAYYATILITGHFWDEVTLYRDVLPEISFIWQHISLSVHRITAMLIGDSITTDATAYRHVVMAVTIGVFAVYMGTLAFLRFYAKCPPDMLLAVGFLFMMLQNPLLEFIHFLWMLPAFYLLLRSFLNGSANMEAMAFFIFGWIMTAKTFVFVNLSGGSVYIKAGTIYFGILLCLAGIVIASLSKKDENVA